MTTQIDKDGNACNEHMHIYRGTNRNEGVWEHPCPNCGCPTYLGVMIPTVTWFSAEYLGTSFHCHNPNCDPIFEEHEWDEDEDGNIVEPFIIYELVDFGAYWDSEDEYFYTPQCPRD
jgi:hypothetical protein